MPPPRASNCLSAAVARLGLREHASLRHAHEQRGRNRLARGQRGDELRHFVDVRGTRDPEGDAERFATQRANRDQPFLLLGRGLRDDVEVQDAAKHRGQLEIIQSRTWIT